MEKPLHHDALLLSVGSHYFPVSFYLQVRPYEIFPSTLECELGSLWCRTGVDRELWEGMQIQSVLM